MLVQILRKSPALENHKLTGQGSWGKITYSRRHGYSIYLHDAGLFVNLPGLLSLVPSFGILPYLSHLLEKLSWGI